VELDREMGDLDRGDLQERERREEKKRRSMGTVVATRAASATH